MEETKLWRSLIGSRRISIEWHAVRESLSLVASLVLQETEWAGLRSSGWLHNTSYQTSNGMVKQCAALAMLFHFLQAEPWLHVRGIAKSIIDNDCEKREGGWWWGLWFQEIVMRPQNICWLKHFCESGSEKWQDDIIWVCVSLEFIYLICRLLPCGHEL